MERMTLGTRSEALNDLAKVLEEVLEEMFGRKVGFALLMFPLFGQGTGGDYVSNVQRDDMIKSLRETADKLEGGKIIGRPIGSA